MKIFSKRLFQVAFYGVLALIAYWWFGLEGESPRHLIFSSPAPAPFPAALLRPVSLNVAQRPLADVLRELSAEHGLLIQMDSELLRNSGYTGQELVSLKVDGIPLYGALSLLVRSDSNPQGPLVVRHKNGVVYVTTEGIWYSTPSNYETRVYPLDVLLSSSTPVQESSLGSAISSMIESQSWAENGTSRSAPSHGVWEAIPGGLVVVQTPDVHDQIERLLNYLRRQGLHDLNFNSADISDPCHVANSALSQKLQQRVDIEFNNASLSSVIRAIAEKYNLPIVWDPGFAADVAKELRFTFRLRGVSLQSILTLLCGDADSRLTIHYGSMLVTSNRHLYRFNDPGPTKTIVQPLVDLFPRLDTNSDQIELFLQKFGEGGRGITSDGQLFMRGHSDMLQRIDSSLRLVREAAFPFPSASSSATGSTSIRGKVSDPSVVWGGTESIRSLADRLAKELDINVWVDKNSFLSVHEMDVDETRSWPQATTSIADYFRPDDLTTAVAQDDVLVLTPSAPDEDRVWTSVNFMGHWLDWCRNSDTGRQLIEQFNSHSVFAVNQQFRFADVYATNYDWRDNNLHRDAISSMSQSAWPPRGLIHTWHDTMGESAVYAFDVAAFVSGFEKLAAQRISESPTWFYGPLILSDGPKPSQESKVVQDDTRTVRQRLEFVLDSVISLTLPTHPQGVEFRIVDDTALSVIGRDDSPTVQGLLDSLARQSLAAPSNHLETVRLDTWSTDRRLDRTAAFLYDVRALRDSCPGIDESGLRSLIRMLTPPSIVEQYRYDATDIEIFSGFLVVIHELRIQQSLARFLNYLHSNPVGLVIRASASDTANFIPDTFFAQNPEWASKTAEELRSDSDRVVNQFRVWALGQDKTASASAIAALFDHLERTIATNDPHACYATTEVLIRQQADRNRLIALIQKALKRPWGREHLEGLLQANGYHLKD